VTSEYVYIDKEATITQAKAEVEQGGLYDVIVKEFLLKSADGSYIESGEYVYEWTSD
jgi:hypothetical protein